MNDFQEDVKRDGFFSNITRKLSDIEKFIREHRAVQHYGMASSGGGTTVSHVLAGISGLGPDHTVSGLTAGMVIIATGATTAQFAAIQDGDLPATIVRTSRQVISGAGLSGGGALSADVTLNVGAGTLLTVGADTVGITPGAADYGYIGSTTTPWDATWRSLSTLAGAGLTHTAGVLAVVSGNTGIVVNADNVTLTLNATSGLQISTGLMLADSVAGAGLTIAGKVLAVGAGTLIAVGADTVGITPGAADYGYIGSTTTPWDATWRSLSTLAGAGLTHTAGVLAVVSGNTGIVVNADNVTLTLNATSGLQISTGLMLADSVAGAGLTIAGKVLAVGAGTLITVGADTVGITPGAADYGYIGSSTTPWAAAWRSISTLAGAGMTHTAGVLNIIAGSGITVNASDVALTTPGTLTVATTNVSAGSHTHAITSSSNPGAVASILASDASGFLTLVQLNIDTIQDKSGGNLTISPAGDIIFNPTGNDLLPSVNYDLNIGALSKKYLAVHAAELWVETLVAESTMATIGGRILVGPTTLLTSDLLAAATTIFVKHNQLASGDRVYLESNGKVEFMAITSAPSGVGPYSYTVTRNLDASGANDWYAGDAIFNTGTTGDGFIDLYSVRGVSSAAEVGPTIVGNVRLSATYNDWAESWAIGNLNGLYGYGVTTYGAAFGKFGAANYLTVDPTNGVRFLDSGNVVRGQLSATTWTLGDTATEHISITATGVQIKDGATVYTDLTAGVLTLGSTAAEHAIINTSGILLKDATVVYGQFAATTTIGVTTGNHVSISAGHVYLKNGATVYTDLAAGALTLGEVGVSKDNILISAGALSIRNNVTERIGMTAAGVLTIKDSAGAAVITLDASAGAEITKKLTLSGASSAIAIGTTPPTSATVGTGIWMDRTGMYGLAANVLQAKFDAATGKITAGAGAVILDVNGIRLDAMTADFGNAGSLGWYSGATRYISIGTQTFMGSVITSYIGSVPALSISSSNEITLRGGDLVFVTPAAETTEAFQVRKADDLTIVLNVDTTNSFLRVGAQIITPSSVIEAHTASATVPTFRGINSAALGASSGASYVANTSNIPTAISQRLGTFAFGGVTTGTTTVNGAAIVAFSGGAWSATSAYSYLAFETCPPGSVTRGTRLWISDTGFKINQGAYRTNFQLSNEAVNSTMGVYQMYYAAGSFHAGFFALNASYDGTNWTARHTQAAWIAVSGAATPDFTFFSEVGLTAGNTFAPANNPFTVTHKSNVISGHQAALATNATDGFLYIPTASGVPTGVPTAYTGKVALQYDTTNNKLYVYNGAWKSVTLA